MERSAAATFPDRTGRGRGQWPGRCCPVHDDAEAPPSTAQLAQRSRTIRSGSRNLWRGQPLASPLILVLFIKYGARCPSAGSARFTFISSPPLTRWPRPRHTRMCSRTRTPGELRADIPTAPPPPPPRNLELYLVHYFLKEMSCLRCIDLPENIRFKLDSLVMLVTKVFGVLLFHSCVIL